MSVEPYLTEKKILDVSEHYVTIKKKIKLPNSFETRKSRHVLFNKVPNIIL
jgi:hypothetical protein